MNNLGRYRYDPYYSGTKKDDVYADIYLAKRAPTRLDMLYPTVRATERDTTLPYSLRALDDVNFLYNNISEYTRINNKKFMDILRNKLMKDALVSQYMGAGTSYGGGAVDLPKGEVPNLNKLNKYEKYALSDNDINDLLNGETNIYTYPQLRAFNKIEDVFNPYDTCVINYLTKKNFGHWCCIILHNDKIEFFDPYGGNNLPDEELKNIPDNFRKESGQTYPHLSLLLYKSGYPIEYNNYKFQQKGDYATCGRHVCHRIKHRNLNIDQYYNMMNKESDDTGLNFDQIVTYKTSS